jgi:hypothetical protein
LAATSLPETDPDYVKFTDRFTWLHLCTYYCLGQDSGLGKRLGLDGTKVVSLHHEDAKSMITLRLDKNVTYGHHRADTTFVKFVTDLL